MDIIINPKTKNRLSIFSKEGKELLKQYVKYIKYAGDGETTLVLCHGKKDKHTIGTGIKLDGRDIFLYNKGINPSEIQIQENLETLISEDEQYLTLDISEDVTPDIIGSIYKNIPVINNKKFKKLIYLECSCDYEGHGIIFDSVYQMYTNNVIDQNDHEIIITNIFDSIVHFYEHTTDMHIKIIKTIIKDVQNGLNGGRIRDRKLERYLTEHTKLEFIDYVFGTLNGVFNSAIKIYLKRTSPRVLDLGNINLLGLVYTPITQIFMDISSPIRIGHIFYYESESEGWVEGKLIKITGLRATLKKILSYKEGLSILDEEEVETSVDSLKKISRMTRGGHLGIRFNISHLPEPVES